MGTQANQRWLFVVEGKFNVLQFQSLTVRYEESTGQTLGYVHACAVGGITVADVDTIQRSAAHSVLLYDMIPHLFRSMRRRIIAATQSARKDITLPQTARPAASASGVSAVSG